MDPSQAGYLGPWAKYKDEIDVKQDSADINDEQAATMQRYEEARKAKLAEEEESKKQKDGKRLIKSATTVFHGADYPERTDGKNWADAPAYLRSKDHDCFIPKKFMHSWVGHSKGVQKIKFIPKTGHLLLSASHDGSVKIWDVMTHRKCMRTYIGHS
jgi:pre-mRNA-processing factor 17